MTKLDLRSWCRCGKAVYTNRHPVGDKYYEISECSCKPEYMTKDSFNLMVAAKELEHRTRSGIAYVPPASQYPTNPSQVFTGAYQDIGKWKDYSVVVNLTPQDILPTRGIVSLGKGTRASTLRELIIEQSNSGSR